VRFFGPVQTGKRPTHRPFPSLPVPFPSPLPNQGSAGGGGRGAGGRGGGDSAMELSMSGSSLRTFGRCVTFLARVASELVLQAHPAKVRRPPPPLVASRPPHGVFPHLILTRSLL